MTIAEPDLTQISFHDVGIMGIVHAGSLVTLTLEDVRIAGVQTAAEVTIDGVNTILRNGLPLSDLQMEEKDGEIFSLRKENGRILLAIQRYDFIAKTYEVAAYSLGGGEGRVERHTFRIAVAERLPADPRPPPHQPELDRRAVLSDDTGHGWLADVIGTRHFSP